MDSQSSFSHCPDLTTSQRDRSLNPILLTHITRLPNLKTLEISGHSQRYYDPALIGTMPALEDLRVMMPDSTFSEAIVGIVKALNDRPIGGLRGLAIIAKVSRVVERD
jgi:hypothetical protein